MSSGRRRRKSSSAASSVLCAALIVIFVLVVYLLAGPGRSGRDTAAAVSPIPEITSTPEPTAAPTPVPVLLGETADMGQTYIDRLTFLGDSITYHLASNNIIPFTHVWVPKNGTLALFNCPVALINYYPEDDPDNPRELSIADCAAEAQPEYLVITLGINGIASLDEEQFKRYYRDLILSIQENSPDTKIICQSIFPVVDSLVPEGIDNAGVNDGNRWIMDVAEETGTRFLNTHDVLTDSQGGLVSDYSPWDGYHLTTAAYDVVLQYIRTHAWQ